MLRYGRDYGRWNGQGRYDWDRPGGYGRGFGGPRNDSWGTANWRNFPGEGAWMGDGYSGGSGPAFDEASGYDGGYGGYATDQGDSRNFGGYFNGYGGYVPGGGYVGYESGMTDYGEWPARRGGGEGSGMRAVDIMTEDPQTVNPDTTLVEVARKMRDLDVGIIPVVDSDQSRRLRGVVTDRDITIRATAEGRDAGTTRVSEVMSTDVGTVNKNDRVREVLEVMRREQVKRVPVTDREGRLVGIIAEADLLADYDGHQQEHDVENTLERIYEPNRGRGSGRKRGVSWSTKGTSSESEEGEV